MLNGVDPAEIAKFEMGIGLYVSLSMIHGSHMLEKYLNLEGLLEKSLKIKSALKSTGKSPKKP